ncbi:MAG: right-handed parallel beta-helix repeat-containing protein, partial [Planctomycetaceae bacterium]
VALSFVGVAGPANSEEPQPAIGVRGTVGCRERPTLVEQLRITGGGIHENYLVDGRWTATDLVNITANDVTLRHCEVRHSTRNGISVYARNVLIDSCRIHHLLSGTFQQQDDAHGITGQPNRLVLRNCEIYYVSGDGIQFDPDRGLWDDVLIENCTFWTGPLPADAAGFRRGERPGEDAVDTKQFDRNPRSRLVMRNCLLYGWKQPSQIDMTAALNVKNNVDVTVENCVLRDNQVCFRLRGPTGPYGGARVTINDCAVYDTDVAVRMEDGLQDLRITRLGFGGGVERRYHQAGRGPWPGYVNSGEFEAPPVEQAMMTGIRPLAEP